MMPELRCPMCGKPNPDTSETCQHCQARLKPLMVTPPESDGTTGGLPDWLRGEQADRSPPESDTPLEGDANDEDWLARLRVDDDPVPDADVSPQSDLEPSADEGDDWLNRIREVSADDDISATDLEAETGVPTLSDDGIPDWLQAEQKESVPTPPEDGGIPDWLTNPTEDTPAAEQSPTTDEGIPDWLLSSSQEEDGQAPSPTNAQSEDLPDFFSGLEDEAARTTEPAEDIPATTPEQDSDLPDWMTTATESADPTPISTSGDETEIPDWFSGPEDEAAKTTESAEDIPATTPEQDSDLSDLMTTAAESADPTPISISDDEAEVPDLYSGLEDEAAKTTEPAEGIPASTPELDSDLPDWMIEEARAADPTPADLSDDESKVPNWTAEQQQPESPLEMPETPAEDDEIPDWLSGLEEDDIEIPIILPDPEPETPEWITGKEIEEISWPEEVDTDAPTSEDETPDWISKLGGVKEVADLTPDETALPTLLPDNDFDDEISDIDEISGLFADLGEDLEISAETDVGADDLAPADLPGWLEAMRPIESDDSAEASRGPAMQTGPLAGLSGVLMAEPEIARLKKPETFSTKLQVSDIQQKQVDIFKNLLATEGEVKPLAKPLVVSSQGLLRWLIAFFLVFVVGLMVISESQLVTSLPLGAVPVEVLNTSKLINTISPGDAVLVSFDYEPGTAGEMEAAAAAVVDHLMLQGAYLSLVSTSPTGPALAERFIHNVQAEHNYSSGNQYTNLGYIPGGASGLLGFTQMPQRITPLSFDGMDAWRTVPLANVHALSDFKLVLIITDNPDVARTWVEQVQPQLVGTPLISVVSAQAEPILKPYTTGEEPQIQGMVSGIIGGAGYELVTGQDNLTRTYWDALNYGLITAIVAILIGGISNIVSSLLRKEQHPPGEAS